MSKIRFEWDPAKARQNERKHGVAFSEAQTVFFDEHALLIDDPDHSEREDRFLIVGVSLRRRILTVVHCYREQDDLIRIISARKATARERGDYEERNTP